MIGLFLLLQVNDYQADDRVEPDELSKKLINPALDKFSNRPHELKPSGEPQNSDSDILPSNYDSKKYDSADPHKQNTESLSRGGLQLEVQTHNKEDRISIKDLGFRSELFDIHQPAIEITTSKDINQFLSMLSTLLSSSVRYVRSLYINHRYDAAIDHIDLFLLKVREKLEDIYLTYDDTSVKKINSMVRRFVNYKKFVKAVKEMTATNMYSLLSFVLSLDVMAIDMNVLAYAAVYFSFNNNSSHMDAYNILHFIRFMNKKEIFTQVQMSQMKTMMKWSMKGEIDHQHNIFHSMDGQKYCLHLDKSWQEKYYIDQKFNLVSKKGAFSCTYCYSYQPADGKCQICNIGLCK